MGFWEDLHYRIEGLKQSHELDKNRAMYYQLRGIPYDKDLYSGKRELTFAELKQYYMDEPADTVAEKFSEERERMSAPDYEPKDECEKMAYEAMQRYGKKLDDYAEYVHGLDEK